MTETPCLTEDEILQWIEGTADTSAQDRVRAHLDACETCFEIVGAAHAETAQEPSAWRERYAVQTEIGRGGMGVVYRGRDRVLERAVAIKVMQTHSREPQSWQRLLDESRIMAKLRHANVVAVHDVVLEHGQLAVVMELVDGHTLRRWAEREQPSWPTLLAMFEDIAAGLHAAHTHGVVHRDFKPDNVLVGNDGRPQITDFGLSSVESTHTTSTSPDTTSGRIAGTPAYMAPEQRIGEAGPRSDLYALCVSLWELAAGRRPQEQDLRSDDDAWAALPRVPRAAALALRRGLSEDPDQRYPDVPSLMAALRPRRRVWPLVTAAVVGLGALTAMWTTNEASTCDPSPAVVAPTIDWTGVQTALVERDGPRGSLLADDVRRASEQTQEVFATARREACDSLAPPLRTRAHDCVTALEHQHAATLQLLSEGTVGVSGSFDRLQRLGEDCNALADVPGIGVVTDVPEAARADHARMRVLGASHDPRAAELATRLVQDSDDARLAADAHLSTAYGLYWSDPEGSIEAFTLAYDAAVGLDDPLLMLDAELGTMSASVARGDTQPVTTMLARARDRVNALPSTRTRDFMGARVAVVAMIAAFYDGRIDDAQRHMARFRELSPAAPRLVPLAFQTQVFLTEIRGEHAEALALQQELVDWMDNRGTTPSSALAEAVGELAGLARAQGLHAQAEAAYDRASELAEQSRVPLAQRRTIDSGHAQLLAELGRHQDALARLKPHTEGVSVARTELLRLQGKPLDATKVVDADTALADLPMAPSIDIATPLAHAHARAGNLEKARALLEARVAWHTEHYPALRSTTAAQLVWGWILLELGEPAEAPLTAARDGHPHPAGRAWASVGLARDAVRRGVQVDLDALREAAATLADAPPGWAYEAEQAAATLRDVQSR